jgi:hypothetical protein
VEAALRVTAEPDGVHRCAAAADAPVPRPLPRSVLDGGDRGAVRVAVGEAALARVLWALQQGGVGCVEVGEAEAPPLAAGLSALLPSARRIRPLVVGAPSVAVRPLAPPTPRVEDDGAVSLAARAGIEIWATVAGRRLRVAAAEASVTGVMRLASRGSALAIEAPHDSLVVEIRDVWSAPVLGASERELRRTFDALASIALAVVPESTPLDLPLPGRVRLASAPTVRTAAGTRALVVDLELEAP